MAHTGGDDLDDLIIDDYSNSSEEEELEEIDDIPADSPLDGEGAGAVANQGLDSAKDSEKKRKRKEKNKERKAKRRKLVEERESDEPQSLAARPPSELASYLFEMTRKVFTDLSELELEDIRIPESAIVDTTAWTGPRTLDQLSPFILKVVPGLHTRLLMKSKANGAPTLIFVTGAALRVADVTRILKSKQLRGEKSGDVAKLFAKHFKLSEHVSYLKRTKIGAAVGTPGRLGKLLCETGKPQTFIGPPSMTSCNIIDALSTSALTHIILDATFRDAKKRNLLDIPETREEVVKTVLGCPAIRQGIRTGKVQLVLF
ncbi:Protein cms1 [Marasmius crinis-equi]|uniref:Protein cms1 n=1 Tax=Marasmius crinis-equi TaxID=585013 RepID=A0ABR3FPB3_9AGAR